MRNAGRYRGDNTQIVNQSRRIRHAPAALQGQANALANGENAMFKIEVIDRNDPRL